MTEVQAPAGYAVAAGAATRGEERAAHGPRGGLAALRSGRSASSTATSALRRCTPWTRSSPAPPAGRATPDNVLGAISLVIWTLTLIVAIKYAMLVLRADNDGEGGVFALYGLLHQARSAARVCCCGR